MKKEDLLDSIHHKLIVSCQARKGWAMYGADIMAAFAKAAEEGGGRRYPAELRPRDHRVGHRRVRRGPPQASRYPDADAIRE